MIRLRNHSRKEQTQVALLRLLPARTNQSQWFHYHQVRRVEQVFQLRVHLKHPKEAAMLQRQASKTNLLFSNSNQPIIHQPRLVLSPKPALTSLMILSLRQWPLGLKQEDQLQQFRQIQMPRNNQLIRYQQLILRRQERLRKTKKTKTLRIRTQRQSAR